MNTQVFDNAFLAFSSYVFLSFWERGMDHTIQTFLRIYVSMTRLCVLIFKVQDICPNYTFNLILLIDSN